MGRKLIYVIMITVFISLLFTGLRAQDANFVKHIIDSDGPQDPWAKIIADFNSDGYPDVAIGGRNGPLVWYKYPEWEKFIISLGGYETVDGESVDVDGDGDKDIVMGGLFWYENPLPEGDPTLSPWMEHQISQHGTHDVEYGDLDNDGDMDIVTRDQSAFSNPRGNEIHVWIQNTSYDWDHLLINCIHGEGIVVKDLDADNDQDIIINGYWYENTGDVLSEESWIEHHFTDWHHSAYVSVGDLNNDGHMDIVLVPAELKDEYYRISWFEGLKSNSGSQWKEHVIEKNVETVYHSLELGDINQDGYVDIITAEMHQGQDPDEVMVYYNQNSGESWRKKVLSKKGTHLLQKGDIDSDGDIDFIGANWSGPYQPIELWQNTTNEWIHHSTENGFLPESSVGRQVATLILDANNDGLNDFMIASYERMVWYKNLGNGWERYAIENGDVNVRMEAGGDFHDIDNDGDLDIVMGAQSEAGEIWWWENPHPDTAKGDPWVRHLALKVGGTHHDQIFGDFDGDGNVELAFWHNRGKTLYLADIPSDPTTQWSYRAIAEFDDEKERPEGLDVIDINGDNKDDIVGGGYWFEHKRRNNYEVHIIDDDYRFTRCATGDLIEGGRPEVIIGSGDQTGPLNLYEWNGSRWDKTMLIPFLNHGHTLRIADVDGDGNLDIYTAEMYRPGAADDCRQMILYGNGSGDFTTQILSTGYGTHEGRLGDLDGDGDLDVLQKDFQQDRRVDIWYNPR